MGFGGGTTLIGCKIGALNRLPASFFVSVAYDCWAFRRLGVRVDTSTGRISEWLYRDPAEAPIAMVDAAAGTRGFAKTGHEIRLEAPIDEATIRSLKVGDIVLVSGRAYTGRDAVHHHLMEHEPPVDLRGSVLYHCGPVVAREGDGWKVTAAGPTTSIREEPYQGDILRRYGVRAVMGKGGMGAKTLAALKETGAVYLNAIGGAAQFYAQRITRVDGVSLMEFGTPEAMWHLWLDEFPAIVTMDAHGHSLHKDVEQESAKKLELLRV
jgi:fumarate hydratase class I